MIEIPLHMIPHTRVLRRILQPARSRQIRKVRRNLRQRVLNRAIGQLLGRQPLRSCAQIRRRARAARPSWRQRRIRPGHRIEVKEVQQIRLGRVSRRKVGIRTNKPALHKFDHGRVIHWDMRHIMPTRERRDHDVRDTKPQLRREPLLRPLDDFAVATDDVVRESVDRVRRRRRQNPQMSTEIAHHRSRRHGR